MKKRVLTLLILAAIWMLGSWWYYTCKIKNFCADSTLPINHTQTTALTTTNTTKNQTDEVISTSTENEEEKEGVDSDGDGLTDAEEIILMTNPNKMDSDGDGVPDNEEVGSEPSAALDTDNDGKINAIDDDDDNDTLPSLLEIAINTNPLSADTDGDGLSDAVEVGNNLGVPIDTDADKLINAIDPDDDNDGLTTLDEIAIGTNPLKKDSDDDGIEDAEEIGKETGKPKDSDGDGIIDALDNNNSPKAKVTTSKDNEKASDDEIASEDEVTVEPVQATDATTLQGSLLYFPFRSADPKLSTSASRYFSHVATWLKESSEHNIVLTGHTDNVGAKSANHKLGLKRANIVKKMLVKQGAPKKQIKTSSQGENKPLKSNETDKGRKKNRRVELTPIIK
ncbi:MAG: OmpA family protein [Cocleimonas sp.]|nr:OmpA family protein [Cocleimonas sp.]